MSKKLTTEEFINRAKKVHGEKYDYSELVYKSQLEKVIFKCPIHNTLVSMLPSNHLAGKGCRKCGYESIYNKVAKTKEKFIEEANKAHNNFYDYSLVEYINARQKVKIICPKHGIFEQTPDGHLRPSGCKKCRNEKVGKINSFTKEEFVEKANQKHNFKYDYSKTEYVNENTKLCIICPIHGEFWQRGGDHLKSRGCKKCGNYNTSLYQKENPNGWSYKTWEEKSKISSSFDSFKIYILKCWNEEEEFYKIGRTYATIKNRFRSKSLIPYNFEVLFYYIGSAKEIVELENKLKKEHRKDKYMPKLKFGGMYECFSNVNIEKCNQYLKI